MRNLASAFCAIALASTSAIFAASLSTPASPLSQPTLRVDILSDTRGVDLQPYMSHLLSGLRQRWLPLVSRAQQQPSSIPGETGIAITITSTGHLAAMHLDDATHVEALDQAAWTATREMSYLPLPSEKNLASLKLRIHFVISPQATDR